MDECTCGISRKQFWLWRDTNEELHASAFKPTQNVERSVYATTVRDALVSQLGGQMPKHRVTDADNATVFWEGRCSIPLANAAI